MKRLEELLKKEVLTLEELEELEEMVEVSSVENCGNSGIEKYRDKVWFNVILMNGEEYNIYC